MILHSEGGKKALEFLLDSMCFLSIIPFNPQTNATRQINPLFFLQMKKKRFIEVKQFEEITVPIFWSTESGLRVQKELKEKLMQMNC